MYQEDIEIVCKNILFQELDKAEAYEVLQRAGGYEKEFSKGQILFQEGDLVKQMGILVKGEVRICRLEFDGGEKLIQKLRVPYLVGADIVCTPRQISPYTAYASEASRICYFPYESLKCPGKIPEKTRGPMKERLLEFIANENIRKLYKVDMLSAASGREKVLKYLMIQCRKAGSRQIEIPYNREELASFLCMNRTVLSHTLSQMEKEGILSFRKNRFRIHGTLPEDQEGWKEQK